MSSLTVTSAVFFKIDYFELKSLPQFKIMSEQFLHSHPNSAANLYILKWEKNRLKDTRHAHGHPLDQQQSEELNQNLKHQ